MAGTLEREGEPEGGLERPPRVEIGPFYRFMRFSTGLFLRLWNGLRVEGGEHLPRTGGVMIVANHASFLDIPAIASSTRRHVSFVARASLKRSPPIAYLLEHTGAVLVEPGRPDRRALRDMVAHLRLGDCVAIFPEGTRSADGRVGRFRGGVTLAARQTGVPLVPAGISGSFAALSRHASVPRPARITVRFGPPIDPSHPEALELARAAVERLVGPVPGAPDAG